MTCDINKIDSNVTGLSFAEEECLKQLPLTPVWYDLEPNSYSDFGGEISMVARSPIDPSRQNKKGAVTGLSAAGGFNIDHTKTNLNRLLQGFFFADIREKPTTVSLLAAKTVLTSVTSGTKTYAAAAGLLPFNKAGYLVKASGFTIPTNNGIKTVASATASTVVVTETVVTEVSTPTAQLEVVGYQFIADEVDINVTAGVVSLESASLDLTTLGLIVGEWVYLGGDTLTSTFVNNKGYARIGTITADAIIFDDTAFAPVSEVGTGLSVKMFFGQVIKNEKTPSLIKRRSYQLERTLGMGVTAMQAEYLEGAVPNEFTLSIKGEEKVAVDLTFVACDDTQRSGEVGDEVKSGTHVAALGEEVYNSTSNVLLTKMSINDPTNSNPDPLFGFVSDSSISIKNGVTPNKAVGVMGAFDMSIGNFDVSGSVTAFFTSVAAIKAIRNNADIGLTTILAMDNSGAIYDIPLLSSGGGKVSITKDQPVTMPVTTAGAQNKNGYTMLYNYFPYLPTVAMPV